MRKNFFCARNIIFQRTEIYRTSVNVSVLFCVFCDLGTMFCRSVCIKYLTKDNALKVFETTSDYNSGPDIEPHEEFCIENTPSLPDEVWIVPLATNELFSLKLNIFTKHQIKINI